MKFDRTFTLHDVEVISEGLFGVARVFTPAKIEERVETLSPGAFAKALKDRRDRIPIRFDGEELPAAIKADEEGLRLGIVCDAKRALELVEKPLELVIRGKTVRHTDEDGVRSITEVAVHELELRIARPMADLVAAHDERLRGAGASEDDIQRTWEGLA